MRVYHQKSPFEKYYYYILLVSAATLCYPAVYAINNLSIVALFLVWLLEGKWKEKWQNFLRCHIAILTVSFYVMHWIGLLYSHDVVRGLNLIVDYLPLLVFPLVLSSISPLSRKQVYSIVGVFVSSCFLATLMCMAGAIQMGLTNNTFEYWFYDYYTLPIQLNSIYFSLYLGFCVFSLGYYLFRYKTTLSQRQQVFLVLGIIYFITNMLLLTSRMTLLSTFVLGGLNYGLYLYHQQRTYQHKTVALYALLACIPLIIGVVISQSAFLRGRLLDIKNMNEKAIVQDMERQSQQKPWASSSAVRLAIWKSSVGVIKEHPLTGVGTGDTQNALANAYRKNNFIFEKNYYAMNTHNQFLQTQLTVGIAGVFLLLAIILLSFYKGWQRRSYFYMTFIVYISINMQTEALLQAQKGVMFIGMMMFLLLYLSRSLQVRAEKTMPVYEYAA